MMTCYQKNNSQRWTVFGLLFIFTIGLFHTAWISDDAAITLRCVLNFIHGYGLTFNVDERVQAFTHPLWCLMLSIAFRLVHDVFLCTWLLSIACSLLALWFFITYLAIDFPLGLVAAGVLLCSKAYLDFSTSGLENPLSHLSLLITVFLGFKAAHSLSFRAVSCFFLCCSCVYLVRPDLVVLLLPVMSYIAYRYRTDSCSSRLLQAMFIGALPALIWTLFSLYYYGFPFPNTAYAKLGAGVPRLKLVSQGILYFKDSLSQDPLTLCFISVGLFVGFREHVLERCLAFGILLYLMYVLCIGGDFMSGRYFTVPLLLASVLFARTHMTQSRLFWIALIMGLLALSSLRSSYLASENREENIIIPPSGIADERAFYFQRVKPLAYRFYIHVAYPWSIKHGPILTQCGEIGFEGLKQGPGVHVLDVCALTDPLLARLKAKPYIRVGHYYRSIPEGYRDSLQSNSNQLQLPALRKTYDSIRMLTRGSLNTKQRLWTIIRFNLGYL